METNSRYGLSFILSSIATTTGLAEIESIMGIILTAIGIISAVISLVLSFHTWYKSAKKDGKIDKEEINDLIDNIIRPGAEEIKESIDDIKDKEKKDK